jgi:excisionase family DNA binding protein
MHIATYINDDELEQRIDRAIKRATTFDPWLAPKEIATYARLSRDHALRALRSGAIEHVGAGKMIRARQSAVDAWLAGRTAPNAG